MKSDRPTSLSRMLSTRGQRGSLGNLPWSSRMCARCSGFPPPRNSHARASSGDLQAPWTSASASGTPSDASARGRDREGWPRPPRDQPRTSRGLPGPDETTAPRSSITRAAPRRRQRARLGPARDDLVTYARRGSPAPGRATPRRRQTALGRARQRRAVSGCERPLDGRAELRLPSGRARCSSASASASRSCARWAAASNSGSRSGGAEARPATGRAGAASRFRVTP